MTVTLTLADESRRLRASSAVSSSAREVRRLHADSNPALSETVAADWTSPGPTVAEFIAEIVRERLDRGRTARTFNLIHPNKLRVVYDIERRGTNPWTHRSNSVGLVIHRERFFWMSPRR